jgi:hypothetical protein
LARIDCDSVQISFGGLLHQVTLDFDYLSDIEVAT